MLTIKARNLKFISNSRFGRTIILDLIYYLSYKSKLVLKNLGILKENTENEIFHFFCLLKRKKIIHAFINIDVIIHISLDKKLELFISLDNYA